MPIGQRKSQGNPYPILPEAKDYASLLNRLLATAKKTTDNHNFGWLGQKKHGIGENFWQFRPYRNTDIPTQIDWRRSARDDKVYVKERELETQHISWIWPDQSLTMQFISRYAQRSKSEHALLLCFIISTLMAKAGQPVGIPEITKPSMHKDTADNMAFALYQNLDKNMPKVPIFYNITRPADIIILSDFLFAYDTIKDPNQCEEVFFENLKALSQNYSRIHLIEIIDPVEENFPYKGFVDFEDPLGLQNWSFGKAERFKKSYQKLYFKKREKIIQLSRIYAWNYLQSYTDRPMQETLVTLAKIFS